MKLDKILSIIVFVVMLLTIVTNIAYAATNASVGDPASITITTGDGATNIQTMGGKIIGIIQVVGSVVAVAILVVLGIKYMMGSTEEKAEYKKTLMPYIVGAVLIFAASNIASVVYKTAGDLTSTATK